MQREIYSASAYTEVIRHLALRPLVIYTKSCYKKQNDMKQTSLG